MSALGQKRTSPQVSWRRDLGNLGFFGAVRLPRVISAVDAPFRARACSLGNSAQRRFQSFDAYLSLVIAQLAVSGIWGSAWYQEGIGRMRARLRIALLTSAVVFGLAVPYVVGGVFKEGDAAHSLVGSYLAANLAKKANDAKSATRFYRSALKIDPTNEVLLEQGFYIEAFEANWQRAIPLAKNWLRLRRIKHIEWRTCCWGWTGTSQAPTSRRRRILKRRAKVPLVN